MDHDNTARITLDLADVTTEGILSAAQNAIRDGATRVEITFTGSTEAERDDGELLDDAPAHVRYSSALKLNTVLSAVENGVLVVADGIPRDQDAEIHRELGLMKVLNDELFEGENSPKLIGSMHLQRHHRQ